MELLGKRFRKTPEDEYGLLRVKSIYLKHGEKYIELEEEIFVEDSEPGSYDSFFVSAGHWCQDDLLKTYQAV